MNKMHWPNTEKNANPRIADINFFADLVSYSNLACKMKIPDRCKKKM